jgi:hypothetical protein
LCRSSAGLSHHPERLQTYPVGPTRSVWSQVPIQCPCSQAPTSHARLAQWIKTSTEH